jgi:hypothetical protein
LASIDPEWIRPITPIASYYCEGAPNACDLASRHDATFVDDEAAGFLGGFFFGH